eukprot:4828696-Pleurochrysis_carterae.AAC.2
MASPCCTAATPAFSCCRCGRCREAQQHAGRCLLIDTSIHIWPLRIVHALPFHMGNCILCTHRARGAHDAYATRRSGGAVEIVSHIGAQLQQITAL